MNIQVDTLNDIHNYGIDLKNREIWLHGYVANTDEDPGVDYRMASTFAKNIRILDTINNLPILIHMHSIGGNWNDGMAIYDAIRMTKSHVTIIAYGQAESMSSIVLQAADKRIMTPNSYFMCHYGSVTFSGNLLDVQSAIDQEKKCTEKMMDIYVESAKHGKFFKESMQNVSNQKIKNYIKRKMKDGDWYLSANEAVYYGFADGVLTYRHYKNIDSLKYDE